MYSSGGSYPYWHSPHQTLVLGNPAVGVYWDLGARLPGWQLRSGLRCPLGSWGAHLAGRLCHLDNLMLVVIGQVYMPPHLSLIHI